MSPEEFQVEVLRRFDVIDERFKLIDERFDRVDERFDRVDERFNRVDERLDRIESEQSSLRRQMRGLTNTVDRMYDVLVDHGRPDPQRKRETTEV